MRNGLPTLMLIGLIALSACASDGSAEPTDSVAPAASSEAPATTTSPSTTSLPVTPVEPVETTTTEPPAAPTTATAESTTTAPDTPDTTAVVRPEVTAGSRYVALGSSYAAGTNIPNQGTVCGRSDRNYPNLVAAALQLELVDVSCSSATTANLLFEPQGDLPPQIEAVTADTELVTITGGGNDVQYIFTALTCGQAPESCVPTLDTATIDTAVADLPSQLEALAVAVRERAPDAVIMLVTYLQVVPPDGAECGLLQLDADEAAYVSDLGQRLDRAFRTAADATDMVLVDAYSPTVGHGPCTADGEPWMSGFDGGPEGVFYHPTVAGHQAMADLVLDAIRNSE